MLNLIGCLRGLMWIFAILPLYAQAVAVSADEGSDTNAEVAALIETATADRSATERFSALQELQKHSLDEAQQRQVLQSYFQDVIDESGWDGTGQRIDFPDDRAGLNKRSYELLLRQYQSPYPEHVVDAFIALARAGPDEVIDTLKDIKEQQGFVAEQVQSFERLIRREPLPERKEQIYNLMSTPLQSPEDIGDRLRAMQNQGPDEGSLMAAYQLKQYFLDKPVPPAVTDVAYQVLNKTSNGEMLRVCAALIAAGSEPERVRQERLEPLLAQENTAGLSVMERHRLRELIFDLYSPDQLELLAVRYLKDPETPWSALSAVLYQLRLNAVPGRELRKDTLEALVASVKEPYSVDEASIERILISYNAEYPRLSYKAEIKKAKELLMIAWGFLVLACPVLSVIVIILLPGREARERMPAEQRFISIGLWSAISTVAIILWPVIVVLSTGLHGPPSAGSEIVIIWWPVIYFVAALLVLIKALKNKRKQDIPSRGRDILPVLTDY